MALVVYALFPALLLLAYGGLLSTYIHMAYQPDKRIETAASHAGMVTLAVYALWMVLITVQQDQVPIANVGQIAAFLGFLIWADTSYVQLRVRQRMLAMLPIAAVAFLLLIGVVAGARPDVLPKAMTGPFAATHITVSLAGVAMLMGAGVFGAGYLILHRQIKSRHFSGLFSRLPSMEDVNRQRAVAVYTGWLLITLSLIASTIWFFIYHVGESPVHPHLAGMGFLWLGVSALALAEKLRWLSQHRLAMVSVGFAGFVLVLILMTVIGFLAGA
jgi:ABC-type uncharacterized transport system permease subunit